MAFALKDSEKVTSIIMTSDEGKVILKRENSGWVVNSEYEARGNAVDMLIQTLQRLRVVSPAPTYYRDDLEEKLKKESLSVEIHKGSRSMSFFAYTAGEQSPTYMLMNGSSHPYEMEVVGFSGNVASLFVIDEGYWRKNLLFNFHSDEIYEVVVYHSDNEDDSFILRQSPGPEFSLFSYPEENLIGGLKDSLAVRYLANFFYIPYERFGNSEELKIKDSLMSAVPNHMVRVTDRDSTVTEACFYKILAADQDYGDSLQFDPFRMHALINEGEDMVVVPYHSVDLILRPSSYFSPPQ